MTIPDVVVCAGGSRFKSDDPVLNLSLLSLALDFGLAHKHAGLLNLPYIQSIKAMATKKLDTKQLQVEISNLISDFETKKKDCTDSVTRLKVEELIFEVSYKFLVNKNFDIHSNEFELIRELMGDHSAYSQYVLLVKIYVSLCQVWSITQFHPLDFSQSRIGVKKVRYQQTHNQGLRQMFLTVSWDLRA